VTLASEGAPSSDTDVSSEPDSYSDATSAGDSENSSTTEEDATQQESASAATGTGADASASADTANTATDTTATNATEASPTDSAGLAPLTLETDGDIAPAATTESFSFQVKTTVAYQSFSIPTSGLLNGTPPLNTLLPPTDFSKSYNWNIDWGDDTSETKMGTSGIALPNAAGIPHTYASAGTHTITITPADAEPEAWLGAFGFYNNTTAGTANVVANKMKVTAVLSGFTPLMTRTQAQIDGINATTPPTYEWAYTFYNCKALTTTGPGFSLGWDDVVALGDYFGAGLFYSNDSVNTSINDITMDDAFTLPQGNALKTIGNSFAREMFFSCRGGFTMGKAFNFPQSENLTTIGDSFAYRMFTWCDGPAFTMNDVFTFPQSDLLETIGNGFASEMFRRPEAAVYSDAITMGAAFNLPQSKSLTRIGNNFCHQMFSDQPGAALTMNDIFTFPQSNVLETIGTDFGRQMFSPCAGPAFTMGAAFTFPQSEKLTAVGSGFGQQMFYNDDGDAFTMNDVFAFPPALTEVGANFGNAMLSQCNGPAFTMNETFTLPQTLTKIGNSFASGMFSYCTAPAFTMNEVFNLPQNATTIGDSFASGLFGHCSAPSFTMNEVFNLPQGENLEKVGNNFAQDLFSTCSTPAFTMNEVFTLPQGENLKEVGTYFGYRMFQSCSGTAFTMNDAFALPQSAALTAIGTNFAQSMFGGCAGSAFQVNDVFVFRTASSTGAYTSTFAGVIEPQKRTATSIIGSVSEPGAAVGTFTGATGFLDRAFLATNWGGDGLTSNATVTFHNSGFAAVSFPQGSDPWTSMEVPAAQGYAVPLPGVEFPANYAISSWFTDPECTQPWNLMSTVSAATLDLYPKVYALTTDHASLYDFGSLREDAARPSAHAFTVANTGMGTLTNVKATLVGADVDAFEIASPAVGTGGSALLGTGGIISSGSTGNTAAVNVMPAEDLLPRSEPYSAVLVVEASRGISLSFSLSLTVYPADRTVPDQTVSLIQHAGDDRFDTAVRASQKAYPDPTAVDSVIVSFSHNFPDALAASYLAGVVDAPILLTTATALHTTTLAELYRLSPTTIYITGGEVAIEEGVEQALRGLSFKPAVKRLGGDTRIQTAVALADEATSRGEAPRSAFVVCAGNYPDALSVGSLAASLHIPVLLTEQDALSEEAGSFLEDNAIKDVIIVGGSSVVSNSVVAGLHGLASKPSVSRWFGTDRYATAKDVVDEATARWNLAPSSIGIASGEDFPDALVGGAAMGNRGGLLVISPSKTLSDAAQSVIAANRTTLQEVELFGGNAVIDLSEPVLALFP
jgi:putative cell wall-binding protein